MRPEARTAAERLIAEVADDVDIARHKDPPAKGHHELLRLAAEARGIEIIEHGDGYIGLHGGRAVVELGRYHQASSTSTLASTICRSKGLQLHLLRLAGVPVPEGRIFRLDESKEAVDYAKGLGWPVVLKPSGMSGGKGVVVGIRSDDELRSAWHYAVDSMGDRSDRRVIVEREHDGVDVRVYVVAGQAVAGTARLPPYVRGDGQSTIGALVEEANKARLPHPHPRRLPIVLDAETDRNLTLQALTRESIPERRRIVLLSRCGNLSLGGVTVDVTDQLPAGLVDLAVRAIGVIPGLDAGGVDFLMPDIRSVNGAVVLEVSSKINISMHHFPVVGQSRDVAGPIVDLLLSRNAPPVQPVDDGTRAERDRLREQVHKRTMRSERLRQERNRLRQEVQKLGEVGPEPSFYALYPSIMRQRAWLLRDHGLRHPIWEADLKMAGRSLATSLGIRVPKLLSGPAPPDRLEEPDADRFVVKPNQGWSGKGVYALIRDGDGLWSVLDNAAINWDEVRGELAAKQKELAALARARGSPWSHEAHVEELVPSDQPDRVLAFDWKCYCIGGRVEVVVQKDAGDRRGWSATRLKVWSSELADLGPVLENRQDRYDPSLPPPAHPQDLREAAERLAQALPGPFVRVDLYDGPEGVVFGEITPQPGIVHRFTPDIDRRLGEALERALAADLAHAADRPASPLPDPTSEPTSY